MSLSVVFLEISWRTVLSLRAGEKEAHSPIHVIHWLDAVERRPGRRQHAGPAPRFWKWGTNSPTFWPVGAKYCLHS